MIESNKVSGREMGDGYMLVYMYIQVQVSLGERDG